MSALLLLSDSGREIFRLLGGGRLGSGGSEGALLVSPLPFLEGADDCDGMIDFLFILFAAMKQRLLVLDDTTEGSKRQYDE